MKFNKSSRFYEAAQSFIRKNRLRIEVRTNGNRTEVSFFDEGGTGFQVQATKDTGPLILCDSPQKISLQVAGDSQLETLADCLFFAGESLKKAIALQTADMALIAEISSFLDESNNGEWNGSATQLLAILNARLKGKGKKPKQVYRWPGDAGALSLKLGVCEGALLLNNIRVDRIRTQKGSKFFLQKCPF